VVGIEVRVWESGRRKIGAKLIQGQICVPFCSGEIKSAIALGG